MNITALKLARTVRITTLWSQRGELTQRRRTELQLSALLSRCGSTADLNLYQRTVRRMAADGLISQKTAGSLLLTTQRMKLAGSSRTSGSSLRPSSSAAAGCSAQCMGNTSPQTFRACIRRWTRRLLSTAVRTK
uniref:Uncharacterized protein n=1 Tax=Klebsiella phage HenuGS TaxID=3350566 RepID=A0AB74UQ13_9CAUD